MSKWTPGPWVAHHAFPEFIVPIADADKKIGGTSNEWERHHFARVVHRQGYSRAMDNAADARLIAAAPEMAELLRRYLDTADKPAAQAKLADIDAEARALLAKVNA